MKQDQPIGGRTAGVAVDSGVSDPRVAPGPRISVPKGPVRPPIDVPVLAERVRAGSRPDLSRAITLVESTRPDHRAQAQQLLMELLPYAGGAHRIGITGVPGVGKSTFIDSFGSYLVGLGHKVAVVAVDPSSTRTGGSILGDKTRMARLSAEPNAFIRPSPSAGTLGGVAKATREAIVVLEAAGFDIVLVETVGVGQSEVTVANMTDVFCFLTLARTGDQLQGIKKGILELADLIAVNKADGKHLLEAKRAAREMHGAMALIHPHDALWKPPVITMSGLEGEGLDKFWEAVLKHREVLTASGDFDANRRRQQVEWTWTMVHEQLIDRLERDPKVRAIRGDIESRVRGGTLTAALAAQAIIEAFDG